MGDCEMLRLQVCLRRKMFCELQGQWSVVFVSGAGEHRYIHAVAYIYTFMYIKLIRVHMHVNTYKHTGAHAYICSRLLGIARTFFGVCTRLSLLILSAYTAETLLDRSEGSSMLSPCRNIAHSTSTPPVE